MRIFSENSCRGLAGAVFAFGICSIFIKNRTNSKRLCRRPDHTALLPNMMPAAEAAMAKANAQSNKRFCGCVLRGDPEGSRKGTPEKPRKDKSPEELPVADTTTRNGMVIAACRVRKTGEMPRNVPRRAVRRTILRVVSGKQGKFRGTCRDMQF